MKSSPVIVNDIVMINKFHTEKPCFVSKPRNTHILGYQISGKYLHTLNGSNEMAQKDTILFINKRTDYCVKTIEPGLSIAFHFTACNEKSVPDKFIECAEFPQLKEIFFGAYDMWRKNGGQPSYMIYSKIYEALEIINMLKSEHCDFPYIPSSSLMPVNCAIKYINEHLCEKISVKHLSELSGKGERHFNNLFKDATGKTPLEYINNIKLDTARRYLETGTYSVSEISHMLGFCDESYFNRLFKSKIGVTPGKYRKFVSMQHFK